MKNYFNLFIIMFITALVITACGGSDSSGGGGLSSDNDLTGWWEGLIDREFLDNCPSYMNFKDGQFTYFWLHPEMNIQYGGMAGQYSADGSSLTLNITHGWAPEDVMNWMDVPDEIITGNYTINGNSLTISTEIGDPVFYKGTEPKPLETMAGTWVYEDGAERLTLTLDYSSSLYTMTGSEGVVMTEDEEGNWGVYTSVETGSPGTVYLSVITRHFVDYDDIDEDGDSSETINSFNYKRFRFTLNTEAAPDTLTLSQSGGDLVFEKDE